METIIGVAGDGEDDEDTSKFFENVGIGLAFELADVILTKLSDCQREVFVCLSHLSGMTVDEVADLDLSVFTQMLYDVVTLPDLVTGFFSGIWSGIKSIFSSVGSWFKNIFSKAWEGIKNAFSPIVNFFSETWQKIKDIFSKVGTAIADGVKGAVTSAINGILSTATKIINGFISAINVAISVINAIPGVSISKLDKLNAPQLEEGGVLKKGQVGILEGNGAEAVVPLEKNTEWIKRVADEMSEATGRTAANETELTKVLYLILDVVRHIDESMYEYMVNALVDGVRLKLDGREFGRMVRNARTT